MPKTLKVKSVKKTGNVEPVYNLEVEDTHNFILSNGVVAHNCYDSLGYLLISRHSEKSKREQIEELTPIQRHKQKVIRDSRKRRFI